MNTSGSFTCVCPDGYSGDGLEAGTQCARNCGNGSLDAGEQCDAGAMNGVAGVCCSETCENIPDCCTEDAQCNENNTCTADICNVATGVCEAELIAGCCLTDAECEAPDSCSSASCNANTCVALPVADCCLTDEECDDSDDCTTDTCANNACAFEPIEACGIPADMGATDMGGMADMGGAADQGLEDFGSQDLGQPDMDSRGPMDFDDEGCGCASTNTPSNGLMALLVLAFVMLRRRLKH